jgi:hypothetical protein
MVRRWSYLTLSSGQNSLLNVRKAHAFKVFRKSTKFKRFNRGLVDFVRRKNIKRKKSINYITLSYLSSNWAKYYLNSRSIARFSQSILSSRFTFEALNPELVKRLAIKTSFTIGLHLTSIPTYRAISLLKNFPSVNLNLLSRGNTRGALVSFNKHDFKRNDINKLGASNYVQISTKHFIRNKSLNLLQSLNYSLMFQPTVSTVASIRTVMVLLALLTSF